jgi:hypothetical protein
LAQSVTNQSDHARASWTEAEEGTATIGIVGAARVVVRVANHLN